MDRVALAVTWMLNLSVGVKREFSCAAKHSNTSKPILLYIYILYTIYH